MADIGDADLIAGERGEPEGRRNDARSISRNKAGQLSVISGFCGGACTRSKANAGKAPKAAIRIDNPPNKRMHRSVSVKL